MDAKAKTDSIAHIDSRVVEVLQRYAPRRVWVAYSGGLDSTALLLAARSAKLQGLTDEVKAIHVNHGLSANAQSWVAHCSEVCSKLDLPLVVGEVQVSRSGNIEANARHARYGVFCDHLVTGDLLLLGHHLFDQTETLLYRLFSGRSLTPMRVSGEMGQGVFERPLLQTPQTDLESYVQQSQVAWIEDESNQDIQLQRNFLRHKVVPSLQQMWSPLHQSIGRVADAHRAQNAALEFTLSRLGDEVAGEQLPADKGARQAWLRSYLVSRGEHGISDRAIAEFLRQFADTEGALMQGMQGQLHGFKGMLFYERESALLTEAPQSLSLGEKVQWHGRTLSLDVCAAQESFALPYDQSLIVRGRTGGETLRIHPGRPRQRVKELLRDAQIPPWRRKGYPLLYQGDEIVCVPGVAVAMQLGPGIEKGLDVDHKKDLPWCTASYLK